MTYPIRTIMLLAISLVTLVFSSSAISQDVGPVAVPDEAKRAESLSLIRDIFEKSYASTKSTVERQSVITKMLTTAEDTNDDDAARYELLRVAKALAYQLGDVDLADQAVQSLGAHFVVDKQELQLELAQKLGAAGKPKDQREAVGSLLEKYFVNAMANEEYAIAVKYAALGSEVATGLRSPEQERWSQRSKMASSLAERHEIVRTAIQKLAAVPDDVDASLVVGEYQCLVRGNWAEGLPLLSQGGDGEVCQAARLDLSPEADPVDIGDAWWDLSEKLAGMDADACRRRADYWYAKALPEATGLTQIRIRKRREDAAKLVAPAWSGGSPAIAKVDLPEPMAPDVGDAAPEKDTVGVKPVIHLEFEERKGNIAHDSAGGEHHAVGENMDDKAWVEGIVGERAVAFDGRDDVMNLGGLPDLKLGSGSFTIAVWIKCPEGAMKCVVTKGGPGSQHWRNRGFSVNGVNVYLGSKANRTNVAFQFTRPLDTDKWEHIAVVRDAEQGRVLLYVNGELDKSFAYAGGDFQNPGFPMCIGANTDPAKARYSEFFEGSMDDFRVYDQALEKAELMRLVRLGQGR